jgi:hypothetical protein
MHQGNFIRAHLKERRYHLDEFLPRQVFLCSPTNALLSAALVSFDQALKASHVKTIKFNALWIFSCLPQGRLVKRHKRGVGHGILGYARVKTTRGRKGNDQKNSIDFCHSGSM